VIPVKKPNPTAYSSKLEDLKVLHSTKNRVCILDIETQSLDPKEGRIICIGIKDINNGKLIVFYHDDEREMIKKFLDYYKRKGFTEIIGYNILFDVRFIFAKCLKYNLTAHEFFTSKFTDLMWIMKSVVKCYSYNKPGTLGEWVEFVFGSGKMPLCDSVTNLYKQGKISEIIRYNKWDVEITYRLWKRINKVLNHD